MRAKETGMVTVFLLLALLAGISRPTSAQQIAAGQPDWADVEAFFDAQVGGQLAERHVAGAVVALVRDGEVLFTKGYGHADVETRTPVDPQRTLFRLGSVTKLFTWTAVMQLVERGQLDLDADVNRYLDFTIPATYPEPITLRHLMSHSAGFEEQLMGIFVAGPEQMQPLARWLPANIPARVRPPGEASSYSNYGTALAGYIVERVSGMPYDDYIEAHILRPLGMANTTTRQPLPPALAEHLAGGYQYQSGAFVEGAFEFTQTTPAGAMSATAADMAAFMIAHLQGGQYNGGRILAEATVQQMHSPLFQHDPRLQGYAHGFQRIERNGQVILSHGGDTALFHSLLVLLPKRGVGLFLSFNSANSSRLRAEVLEAFLNHFYPAAAASTAEAGEPAFTGQAARLAGAYRSNRHAYSTPDKIIMLTDPVWQIRAEGEQLVLDHPWRREQQRYEAVAPLLFQQLGGQERLAFRENEGGQVVWAFLESEPAFALERIRWYETASFNLGLLGAVLLLFAAAPVVELVRAVRGRRKPTAQPRLAVAARWLVAAAAVLSIAFLVLTGVTAARLMASLGADQSSNAMLALLAWMPRIIALLALASAVLLAPVWARSYWGTAGRVYYTLLVIAAIAFVWFMSYWNLLAL